MKNKIITLIILCAAFISNAQRNVLLIIADDLGTDYFGFYEDHQDTVDVPNIRALLSKGVRFKNGMSNPVCSATRSGILTGRYSFRTGVGGVVGGIGGSNQLDTAEVTIPRLLNSYNSNIIRADIGKWHLQLPAPTSHLTFPNVMGFQDYEGGFIGQLTSYTSWTKYTNGVTSTCTNYATTENVNNAITFIKTQPTKPFFVWLAFNAPHEPLHLPPANLHTYNTLSGTAGNINTNPKSYFKAMIQAMDTEIGRLFDSLRVMNKMDSTDVIFIGDNGNTSRTAQIADLTKTKGTVYQYGVHVPFIVAGPSVVNPGRTSDALINTTDIFATTLDLFGFTNWASLIPINKPVDSKSLLPIIKNTGVTIRPWSFCETFKLTPDSVDAKGIRNIDYKLIRFDYGLEEFYNLSSDPNESNNLLLGTLTSTDLTNYNYLCNELTNLVGTGITCTSSVGIKTNVIDEKLFSVYPNPAQKQITINSPIKGDILIYNSLGIEVKVVKMISNKVEIDLEQFYPGIYILRQHSDFGETVHTSKFVVEN